MCPKATSFRIRAPIILRIVLLASLLLFPVSANETSIPPPIVFTTQPQDVSAALGETATFTIATIGAPPISYQWRFNGTPIAGATNTHLVLTNITAQDFGYYKVVASNPLGTAQSTTAFLLRSPSLQILPAIEVVIRLEPYHSYHLESSVDLSTWTVIETNVWDPVGELSRLYQARGQKVYYRARMFVPDAPLHAPRTAAALQNSRNTYTIQLTAEPNPYTLTFPTAGEYLLTQQEQTNRGTATHFLLEGNTWTFNFTPNDTASGALPTSVRMEFTSVDSGTWVFFTEGQPPRVGIFIAAIPRIPIIFGRALQLSYLDGGGEHFDFTTETSVSYEYGAFAGNYSYDFPAGVIHITLTNGWNYEIDLSNPPTATVTFRETPFSTPDIQEATYIFGFF